MSTTIRCPFCGYDYLAARLSCPWSCMSPARDGTRTNTSSWGDNWGNDFDAAFDRAAAWVYDLVDDDDKDKDKSQGANGGQSQAQEGSCSCTACKSPKDDGKNELRQIFELPADFPEGPLGRPGIFELPGEENAGGARIRQRVRELYELADSCGRSEAETRAHELDAGAGGGGGQRPQAASAAASASSSSDDDKGTWWGLGPRTREPDCESDMAQACRRRRLVRSGTPSPPERPAPGPEAEPPKSGGPREVVLVRETWNRRGSREWAAVSGLVELPHEDVTVAFSVAYSSRKPAAPFLGDRGF